MRMSAGRSTLSSVPTTAVQTTRNTPQPMSPPYSSQAAAGSSTGTGPICARHNMNISAVSSPTIGTPAAASATPPSSDCTMAVTPTPSATPRMASLASCSASTPRSPPRRRANRRAKSAKSSPTEYITAAMTTVTSTCSTTKPTLPTSARTHRVTSPA